MTDFYDPFTPSPGYDQPSRSRRPDVSKLLSFLFVGEYPRVDDIAWLKHELGISAVLSLQDNEDLHSNSLSLSALTSAYRHHQIAFCRTPIADFDCQSLGLVLPTALKQLHAFVQGGHAILLHCNAGCNRAPTLAIAYLHQHHAMTLNEARDFVKARRPCGPYMKLLFQYFGQR